MNLKVSKKSIFWAIGAIVIGIASNAIWEFLFKPLLLFTQNGVLTLTTLGIQRFKDAIYLEIAKGHYDRASESVFLILMFTLMFGAIAANVSQYIRNNDRRKRRQEILSELNDTKGDTGIDELPTLESLEARLTKLTWINTGVVLLLVITATTVTVKIKYVGSAVAYYDQLTAIAAPYLSDAKAKLTDSEFAQIKNRNDYDRIILELRSVAQKNGQSVPEFDIW